MKVEVKRFFNKFGLQCGALILFSIIVYIPVIKADFVQIDDPLLITKNQALRNIEGLEAIWFDPTSQPLYCPVVSAAFWVEYHLWGLNPQGYHLVNILLHAASGILLLWILMRLSVPGAFLASLIFIIHPVQVESLAWVAELKNILSGFFCLAAVYTFLRCNPPDEKHLEKIPWRYYIFSLFLFVCALLSKPTTSTTAPALLVVYWWKRSRITLRDVQLIAPMFVLGVATGFLAVKIESSLNYIEVIRPFSQRLNLDGSTFSFIERCLIAGRAIWFYASKILWPIHLTIMYTSWKIDVTSWSQYIYPATTIAAIVSLWCFRKKIGRGPLAAVLIFVGTLAPVLGFIDYSSMVYTFVEDHFQYVACIGLITLITASGAELFRRFGSRFDRVGQVSGVLVVLSLSLLSFRQGNFYKRDELLRINHIRICPDSPFANLNMSDVMFQRRNVDKAILYIQEAIRLWPYFGKAYNSLGVALIAKGKIEESVQYFYESLKTNPEKAPVYFNLAFALAQIGDFDKAIDNFSMGLRYDPDNAEAHYNLGVAYLAKGSLDAGIEEFRAALQIKPDYNQARDSLLFALKKKQEMSAPPQ